MKSGAHQQDQVIIKKMFNDDNTAHEISEQLGIELSCVESFAPKKNPVAAKAEPVTPDAETYAEEKPAAAKTNPLKPKK